MRFTSLEAGQPSGIRVSAIMIMEVALMAVCMLATLVRGDAYMLTPSPYSRSDLRGKGCFNSGTGTATDCSGPCDVPASDMAPPVSVRRGTTLPVSWVRNGHTAGFVRLSVIRRNDDLSDTPTQDSFSAGARTLQCFEPYLACQQASSAPPMVTTYTDSSGTSRNSWNCTSGVEILPDMADGIYTVQWAWFGGYDESSQKGMGDHYSCTNIQVNGGAVATEPMASTLSFQGGDILIPGQRACRFVNAQRLGKCIFEPCANATTTNATTFVGDNVMYRGTPDGMYTEIMPIPEQKPQPSATTAPSTDGGAATGSPSSDQVLTVTLSVILPSIALAMVVGSCWYAKTHPLPAKPTTDGSEQSGDILRTTSMMPLRTIAEVPLSSA